MRGEVLTAMIVVEPPLPPGTQFMVNQYVIDRLTIMEKDGWC